jgi:hypothetical protein
MATVTIDATTLSAAVTSRSADSLAVASATGIAAGNLLYANREAMLVRSVSGTTVFVTRGIEGTVARLHQSGAVVHCGPKREFYSNDVIGYANSDEEYALPHINVRTGNIFQIADSKWVQLRINGYSFQGNLQEYDYTAAGAIAIAPGVHKVNGSTLAMTLADPSPIHNGMLLTVTAANASAHTLAPGSSFGGGGSGENLATFSGAIGDSITLIAQDSLWYIVGAHQVTVD